MARQFTRKQYVAAAHRLYQDDGSLEIDESATISEGVEHGAYVQAWIWVRDSDIERNE